VDLGRKAVDAALIEKRSALWEAAKEEPYALGNEAYGRNRALLERIFLIASADRDERRAWADEVSRQAALSEEKGELLDAMALLSGGAQRFGKDLCQSVAGTRERMMRILTRAKERDGIEGAELLCRVIGFAKPLWPEQAKAIPIEAISELEGRGELDKAAMLASFWSIDQSRYGDEEAPVSKADALRLILLSEGR